MEGTIMDKALTLLAAAIAIVLVASAARARTLTHGDMHRAGSHWCNWSITSGCTRWKARGGKVAPGYCTGPNDMRSGCVAQRKGLR
jgi:hypothetical protein